MVATHTPLATALGTYDPTHYIVAVFPNLAAALRAQRELTRGGFADSAAICPGLEFLENWGDFAGQRGLLARLVDLFPAELAEYLAAAEHGAAFVTVRTKTPGDRSNATALLRSVGGTAMRYYGESTITDLT
jgi:hypothetical protein